ncbi:MAG: HDOD domain-containing protein [Pseudomonadota bacterium]
MSKNDQFRFVSLLALELENGDISLPSLPDVVLKIRKLLENDACDFEQISQAVSVDPALVSRLVVFANSAYYNRANVTTETLDAAIGRLGFEAVRSTAMSLTMKQLYASDKHSHAEKYLRAVWAKGMKLSCMAFAVARRSKGLNEETAFLCGLMNEVGKLYIITKAKEFPEFMGDQSGFETVLQEWNAQVSKSIIESWGFSEDMAMSADPAHYLDPDPASEPRMVDVVAVAHQLLDIPDDKLEELAGQDPSFIKLDVGPKQMPDLLGEYREKLTSMQQSLA